MPATPPSAADVLAYLTEIDPDTTETLASVAGPLATETAAQARLVRLPASGPYPADLQEALFRRVARNLFMRGVPSGLQSSGEGSTTVRIGRDPETFRLEAPHRRMVQG